MYIGAKKAPTLQSRTGPVQGQNRDFPVYFSHTGKTHFSLQGSQVIETGFSLLGKIHREIPVFITGMGLQCISMQYIVEMFLLHVSIRDTTLRIQVI